MAAIIPVGYQNLSNGVWGKNIKIKGKTFQVVVNPTTEQKWIYEQDTFGNGKPLLTITKTKPTGFSGSISEPVGSGNSIEDFSFNDRYDALKAAGFDAQLLVTSLKQETTWANVQGTQPAPGQSGTQTPGSADPGPGSGIGTVYGPINPEAITNELTNFGDKNNFDKLKEFLYYPENIGRSEQDRIIIRQIEYVPASIAEGTTLTQTINTLSNRDNQFKKILGEVYLPIPNEISETNTTGWGEDNLSAIAGTLMANSTEFARGLAEASIPATMGSLSNAFGLLGEPAVKKRLERYLVSNAAASVLKLGNINVNPEAFLTRATGVAINPNLELLFNGPKLRQFGFSFKMTPRSEKEAKHIRAIIKFFKKGMAPRRSTQSAKSIFLGSPNVFQMEFQSGSGKELKSIGKIKICALVSCGVNYTPDGFYAAFQDSSAGGSQPISVVLSLGFTELTPIFNDDYDTETESKLTNIGPDGFNFVVGPTDGAGNASAPGNEQTGRQGPPTPGTRTAGR